jgi:hypothetical protein
MNMSAIQMQSAPASPGADVTETPVHDVPNAPTQGDPNLFAKALEGQSATPHAPQPPHVPEWLMGAQTRAKKNAKVTDSVTPDAPTTPGQTPQTPVIALPIVVPATVSIAQTTTKKPDAAIAPAPVVTTGTPVYPQAPAANLPSAQSGSQAATANVPTIAAWASQLAGIATGGKSVSTTAPASPQSAQNAFAPLASAMPMPATTASILAPTPPAGVPATVTPAPAALTPTFASAPKATATPANASTNQNPSAIALPKPVANDAPSIDPHVAQITQITHVEVTPAQLAGAVDAHAASPQSQSAASKPEGALTPATPSSAQPAHRAVEGASASGDQASAHASSTSQGHRGTSQDDSTNDNPQDSSAFDKASNGVAAGQGAAQTANAPASATMPLKAGDTISVGELVDRQSNVAPTVNSLTQASSTVHADVIHPELGRISVETQMHQGQINVVLSSDLRQTVHRLVEESPRLSSELAAANASLGTITVKETQAGTSSHDQPNQQRQNAFESQSESANNFGGSSSSARHDRADGGSDLSDTESSPQAAISPQNLADRSRVRIVL